MSKLSMSAPPTLRQNNDKVAPQEEGTESFQQGEFVNDGLFSWMQPYLNLYGMTEGKMLKYGIPFDVDDSQKLRSSTEAEALRQKSIDNFTNIGMEERQRRAGGAVVAAKLAAVYAVSSSLFLDDGSLDGHLARFAVVLPLFFARGYKLSADTGL